MDNVSIKSLVAMVVADIDIFLLQAEDQTEDNDKEFFTKSEIRGQLHKTMINTCKAMHKVGFNIEKPLEMES